MKKFLSIISLCFVMIMIFTFAGCGVTVKGGPAKTDNVTSNGGLAVQKGNYLYFVNGYVSNSNLSGKDNNYGEAKNGAIYRAKLVNGELQYKVTVDEDGNETKELIDVELLVPMIAGFEYTNLYVFGETLYFATPNTEKDSTGKTRFDLTDIYAVSINGGSVKRIVKALNLSSSNDYKFNYLDGKVYLTYLNNNNLYNVRIKGKKVENTTKIASKVSSFAISETNDGSEYYVYYSRSFNDNEHGVTGNVLAKTELKTNNEIILCSDNKNTFSVKKVINDKIYYTRTNKEITNSYIYSKNLTDFLNSEEKQYTVVSYSNNQFIFDLGTGYTNGIIVNEKSKLLFLTGISNLENDIITLYDGEFTVLGIYGEFIYGQDADSNLIRVNIQTKNSEVLVSNEVSFSYDMKTNFDYNSGYAYYYVKYTGDNNEEGYYLNRVYLSGENKETEFIGELLSKHIKSAE